MGSRADEVGVSGAVMKNLIARGVKRVVNWGSVLAPCDRCLRYHLFIFGTTDGWIARCFAFVAVVAVADVVDVVVSLIALARCASFT